MNLVHKITIHDHLQSSQGLCKIKQTKVEANKRTLATKHIQIHKLLHTTIHEPHAQNNHSWPSTK
jgi:hypothetical protein